MARLSTPRPMPAPAPPPVAAPAGARAARGGGLRQARTPPGGAKPRPKKRGRIKILFLSADALPERPRRIADELRAIEQRLRASRYRDAFELKSCSAVRLEDVPQGLLEYEPDVARFAGHGDSGTGLVLLDDKGRPAPVSAEALASRFQVLCELRLMDVNYFCRAATTILAGGRHGHCSVITRDSVHFAR
ncbi:MAG TPA: hypothetical protein VFS43_27670 [Polyangiaceae bacterium]|nr:hypothetical protein [Polyangiaceae bacterium]